MNNCYLLVQCLVNLNAYSPFFEKGPFCQKKVLFSEKSLKDEVRHFSREFKTNLLTTDQYDDAERIAGKAALEIAERAKKRAQGTVNGKKVEDLFGISPTAISN